ncbi:MAG: hypothetical protein ACYDDF_14960 [Thermoplasmatota archaeon]
MERAVAALVAVPVIAVVLAATFGAPFSFVHPDEASAALQADHLLGRSALAPSHLPALESLFVPYGTVATPNGPQVLNTAFGAEGGIGFAFPAYLSIFGLVGNQGMYAAGIVSLTVLYIGCVLFLGRRERSSWLMALVLVSLPPAVLQATVLFSNLPGLAYFVLGLGLVAEGLRENRSRYLFFALASCFVSAGLRREYAIGLLAALVLIPLYLWIPGFAPQRQRYGRFLGALALGVIAAVLGAIILVRLGTGEWGLPYLTGSAGAPSFSLSSFAALESQVQAEATTRHHVSSSQVFSLSADQYWFGFLPATIAIGLTYVFRPSSKNDFAWLLAPLALQGAIVWYESAGTLQYATGCSCMDGSEARYLLPLYATFALLGILLLRDLLVAVPWPRVRRIAAIVLVIVIVLPSTAQAYSATQGTLWVTQHKEWQSTFDQNAGRLPTNAVLIGNYLSKIVYVRPVLTPAYAGGSDNLGDVVRYIELKNHTVFVDKWWAVLDEGQFVGSELLADGHLYFRPTGIGNYTQVLMTNATVMNVYSFQEGEWNISPSAPVITGVQNRSFFQPVEGNGRALPVGDWTLHNGTVTFTFYDSSPGARYAIGYGGPDSSSIKYLACWTGNGSRQWWQLKVSIPRGFFVHGNLFFEGRPTLSSLSIQWDGKAPVVSNDFVPGSTEMTPLVATLVGLWPAGDAAALVIVSFLAAFSVHTRLKGKYARAVLPAGGIIVGGVWISSALAGTATWLEIAICVAMFGGWLAAIPRNHPAVLAGFRNFWGGMLFGLGGLVVLIDLSHGLRDSLFLIFCGVLAARVLIIDPTLRHRATFRASAQMATHVPEPS